MNPIVQVKKNKMMRQFMYHVTIELIELSTEAQRGDHDFFILLSI